jgi:hypothetical protein
MAKLFFKFQVFFFEKSHLYFLLCFFEKFFDDYCPCFLTLLVLLAVPLYMFNFLTITFDFIDQILVPIILNQKAMKNIFRFLLDGFEG